MKIDEKSFYGSKKVRAVFFLVFIYAIFGFYNEFYLQYGKYNYTMSGEVLRFIFSHYAEYIAILVFGTFAVYFEKNRYTRRRILTVMIIIALFWMVIPLVLAITEPTYAANLPFAGVLPSIHVPGVLMFLTFTFAAFFFGRRFTCGWNCTCVAIRETVGRPWRKNTIKTKKAWRLRHLKWVFLSAYLIYAVLIFMPPSDFTARYFETFWKIASAVYFGSFIFVPVIGNRNYCRFTCQFGGLYGFMQRISPFYSIKADVEKCTECKKCERDCDMGIPVVSVIKKTGQIKMIECMGCGRCVAQCPTGVLRFHDFRDYPLALINSIKNMIRGQKIEAVAAPDKKPKKPKPSRLDKSDVMFALAVAGSVTLALTGLTLLLK